MRADPGDVHEPRPDTPASRGSVRRRPWRYLPPVLWLTLLWAVLWGTFTVPTLIAGAVVAAGTQAAFGLPPRGAERRHRLPRLRGVVQLPALIGYLLVDLVVSSVVVAREAVRSGPRTRSGIVEVELRARSDAQIATVALLTLVAPGSLVLEIDRERRLLYVHALPLRGAADAEGRRAAVARIERRLLAMSRTAKKEGPA
ncbi:Na+/H+ antiporter subunit E [Streptomyces harbinensis]|uniref:Multicomponent Na+:H+ antiporter subunit E n=1 Tax=Streptomyces harbinensis TaxID=1176198 RepID=A0A1I6R0H2_9ACTN|nr:Na+/H+ antiporter subunit E [Streptomyces harbinensis]SFS58164.1 multicomponent Na+:H+ antiporter subunit E [Streptomyces harbinensis]